MDASTDSGTVLNRGSWAIIWSPEEGYFLDVPNMPEGSQVPDAGLLLTACFVRIERDEEFRNELVEWFKSLKSD